MSHSLPPASPDQAIPGRGAGNSVWHLAPASQHRQQTVHSSLGRSVPAALTSAAHSHPRLSQQQQQAIIDRELALEESEIAAEVEIPESDPEIVSPRGSAQHPLPLDGSISSPNDIPAEPVHPHRPPFSWRVLWSFTGPGWLMSIAYLDPGNLESDLQAGAYTGYQLIWVLFWSTVLGLILQILAARLGVVTGKHLAQVCRENYAPRVAKLLWLMTELAIIGSDIQEVIGSAIAFKILFGLPLWAGVLITAADTFTFLGLHAFGVRKLEAFFAILIGTMSVCFFVNFGVIQPSATEMALGLAVPDVSDYAVVQAVSILGAVIMPHNIYLHSALVQSRAVDRSRPDKVREANLYFGIEAAVALGVSFFINLAVVAVFAKGFFNRDCAEQGLAWVVTDGVGQCDTIGLEEAGDALSELLGSSASKVWAVGLLAAGQSSTMTGTFAGQHVMEGFMTWKVASWKRVAITRGMALIPAVSVALLARSAGSHLGDQLDEWLNLLQSIQLPFALLPILHFTSSPRIMGPAFVNSLRFQCFGWSVVVGVIGINFYLVASQVLDFSVSGLPNQWWMYLILVIIVLAYVCFIGVIVWNDVAYAWALLQRRLGRGGRGASLLLRPYSANGFGSASASASPSDEEYMSLETAFDQPAVGSPAWMALERLAGRADLTDEDAAAESAAEARQLAGDAATPHSPSALLPSGGEAGRSSSSRSRSRSPPASADPEFAVDADFDGAASSSGGSSPYQQLGQHDRSKSTHETWTKN